MVKLTQNILPINMPLKKGSLIGTNVDKYIVNKLIGKGAFAEVYEAQCESKKFALKYIKTTVIDELLHNELNALVSFHHDNILSALDLMKSTIGIFVVMPLCERDLLQELNIKHKFTEDEAREVMRQIIAGMSFAHSCGYVHRDLSKSYTSNTKLISDWGLSSPFGNELLSESVGSINYAAPEVIIK